MVQFTPYTNPDRDPKYDFREPDGPKASRGFGELLTGIAGLAESGIKAADTIVKDKIDTEAREKTWGLKAENTQEYQELTGNVLQASQTPTGGSTEGISGTSGQGSSSQINAVGASKGVAEVPSAINGQLRHIDKMNQALKQGNFDDERFYGEVQSVAANLISRYPGYADYIQQKVTHYLGSDPANAQRQALQQTIHELIGGKKTNEDHWDKEVMTYAKLGFGEEWVRNALTVRDPHGQNVIRGQAAGREKTESDRRNAKANLDLKLTAGTSNEIDHLSMLSRDVNTDVSHMMGNMMVAAGNFKGMTINQLHEQIAERRFRGENDPEYDKQAAAALGQVETEFDRAFDAKVRQPQFNRQVDKDGKPYFLDSYDSLIKDKTKIADIKKQSMTYFQTMRQQLGSGLFDAATVSATMKARMLDNEVLKLYGNQALRTMSALGVVGGPGANALFATAMVQDAWKTQTSVGEFLLKAMATKTLGGGSAQNNNLNQLYKDYGEAARQSSQFIDERVPPEYVKGLFTTLHAIIRNDKEITQQQRVNAAEVISNPNTPLFLDRLTKSQQFTAWGSLYAPDISEHIKTRMATEVWQRYRETGERVFVQLFNTFANDVKQANTEDRGIRFQWNPSTQQLVPDTRLRKLSAPDYAQDPAVLAANRLNEGFRTLADLIGKDGQKINAEYLSSIGIDLNKTEKSDPTLGQYIKAIRSTPMPVTQENSVKRQEEGRNIRGSNETDTRGQLREGRSILPEGRPVPGGLSTEEQDKLWNKGFSVGDKEITDPNEMRSLLDSAIKTPEGRVYMRRDTKLYPIDTK